MLWKMKFNCLIFSLCYLIKHCFSTGYELVNIRVLYIEGKVNGETYQNRKDVIPRDIIFDNEAVIEYTCSYTIEPNHGSFELYWIQEKGPRGTLPVFYGERTSSKSKSTIKLTAYKFDSDSKISCVLDNIIQGKSIPIMKTEIKMRIKDTSEEIQPSTNIAISDGHFKLECGNESREYAVPSNNKIIITNNYELRKLNVSEHNGITFYCATRNKQEIDDYVLTERVISNITILNYNGKVPTIITTAGGVNLVTIIIIVVVVKIVVVILLCSVLCFYKKRKRTEEAQNLDEGLHPEPASDTLPRVIYGELQKAQKRRSSLVTEPYAEIVGVTTSASDLNEPPDA